MSTTEKERETHVYMAKLAEQAERYEGRSHSHSFIWWSAMPLLILFDLLLLLVMLYV